MTNTQKLEFITTAITTLVLTAILGIPVFHFAAAMIINTAWRHRHTGLTKPIYVHPPTPSTNFQPSPAGESTA